MGMSERGSVGPLRTSRNCNLGWIVRYCMCMKVIQRSEVR